MFGGDFQGHGQGVFNQSFRAYPVAFIDKTNAERGDKILLPSSALQTLASAQVQYPMLFCVDNKRQNTSTHCGVLEFIAQEGMCYMPQWMMDNLLLEVGDIVNIKSVALPKGTFIKIQPHQSDFLDISNPKAVLETSLRQFTCLTEGDTIVIEYNSKLYHIDVLEAKPQHAITVIETDIVVDFAPPKDYKEPDWKAQADVAAASTSSLVKQPGTELFEPESEVASKNQSVFGGCGRRLDGKASLQSVPVPDSQFRGVDGNNIRRTDTSALSGSAAPEPGNVGTKAASMRSGKVMSGSDVTKPGNRLASRLQKKPSDADSESHIPRPSTQTQRSDKATWSAFGGKGRALQDK